MPSPVRLLNSEWLFARADALAAATTDEERAALALPCRQDLERDYPEAFLTLAKARRLVSCTAQYGYHYGWTGAVAIGAISHAWIHPDHPDRDGVQLLRIVGVLRAAQRGELPRQQRGWDPVNPRRHGLQKLPAQLGLFYDWCSIYQAHKAADGTVLTGRTPPEQAAFDTALRSMQVFYAHQKLFALLVSTLPDGCEAQPYDERGWPTCERAWTMVAKPNNIGCWPMILDSGDESLEARRRAPMHPTRLAALLDSKTFTSPKADRPLVSQLYDETMRAVLGETKKISFGECGWDDADIAGLAEVLPMCTRCEKLNLGRNAFGDDGVRAICAALKDGALPRLRVLALNDNRIGDEGLAALADVARSSETALRHVFAIYLMNNTIGDAGCRALAAALDAGALLNLGQIWLGANPASGTCRPLCKFWAAGNCTKGDECGFHHGPPPPKSEGWRVLEDSCRARAPPIEMKLTETAWGTST